jgi:glycine cleavage system H protein
MKRAILACTGLDKAEGSLAREVAIRYSEATGNEIVCPVLLNRAPARYRKVLDEANLIVIDGCATRCASKLAAQMPAKMERKVLITDALKASSLQIRPDLRLDDNGLAIARKITDRLIEDLSSQPSGSEKAAHWETPSDYILVVHDKFEFRIPSLDYLFNENDCWVRAAGGIARVGISDYMQQRLTDIGFFTPPEIGLEIGQFGELGAVESAKATFEIVSPVSGVVTAVNSAAADNPGLINVDPYGAGWLVELKLQDLEQDRELLLDGAAYSETVKRKAAEP